MLALGELQMVRLPKNKFDLNSWRIFDPFMKFGHVLMLRTMENLIAQNALVCSGDSRVVLSANTISQDEAVGFLEEVILKEVHANPGCSLEDCMKWCFATLMDNDTAVNPAKYIIGKIVRSNRFQYWRWTQTNGWFSTKVEITIEPGTAEEMRKNLASASDKVQLQMNQSTQLSSYSQYFSTLIDKQLSAAITKQLYKWTDSS